MKKQFKYQFQSTRPRGRTRRTRFMNFTKSSGFNPRVLAGGRDTTYSAERRDKPFQSTRPRGRTRRYSGRCKRASGVSIHASSREDATTSSALYDRGRCFNPRVLAGGRDLLTKMSQRRPIVSIHASSREDATIFRQLLRHKLCFNPRVLAGGRDLRIKSRSRRFSVSIHASSREDATSLYV